MNFFIVFSSSCALYEAGDTAHPRHLARRCVPTKDDFEGANSTLTENKSSILMENAASPPLAPP
jgi:hypothetical protein